MTIFFEIIILAESSIFVRCKQFASAVPKRATQAFGFAPHRAEMRIFDLVQKYVTTIEIVCYLVRGTLIDSPKNAMRASLHFPPSLHCLRELLRGDRSHRTGDWPSDTNCFTISLSEWIRLHVEAVSRGGRNADGRGQGQGVPSGDGTT
jgi:hypothetical protein